MRTVSRATLAVLLLSGSVSCGPAGGASVRVVVPRGATLRVAADSLAQKDVIEFPRLFRLYAKLKGSDRSVKAGTYAFARGQSWSSVLRALVEGRGLVHSFTIPEGWAIASIGPAIARSMELAEDSVTAALRDTALLRELDIPTPTLEGYLFPDTYTFPAGTGAREVIEAMVERFQQVWKPEWDARLQTLAMTRHDIVALASIIEREARLPEERAVISAVYHNRLKKGMLLQADPTVQYALGKHTERVLYRDLLVDSKYNTYRYRGLPPGPIAAPGAASLEAALFPASVDFLYFVAHPDGHHEFRRTFREHTVAVQQMRAESRQRRPSGDGKR
jgi:UPF0755 protein